MTSAFSHCSFVSKDGGQKNISLYIWGYDTDTFGENIAGGTGGIYRESKWLHVMKN